MDSETERSLRDLYTAEVESLCSQIPRREGQSGVQSHLCKLLKIYAEAVLNGNAMDFASAGDNLLDGFRLNGSIALGERLKRHIAGTALNLRDMLSM